MAVFRVEKNHNYTVMSNYHLRDTTLTLKAIGLLSKMLSLTDEWDYTTRGLAAICKEGVDAIGAALKELESHGYLVRRQLRDSRGRITDTEYTTRIARNPILWMQALRELSGKGVWIQSATEPDAFRVDPFFHLLLPPGTQWQLALHEL